MDHLAKLTFWQRMNPVPDVVVQRLLAAGDSTSRQSSCGMVKHFGSVCPTGYAVYVERTSVGRVFTQSFSVSDFAHAVGHRLELRADLDAGPGTFAVAGLSSREEAQLGYVDPALGIQIARTGLLGVLRPRLLEIYMGERPDPHSARRLDIEYRIIGPQSLLDVFTGRRTLAPRLALKRWPASRKPRDVAPIS